jgi:hypothetical protein
MIRIIVVAVLVFCILGACKRTAPVSDVDKAAGLFFLSVKQGEFDRIYNDSAQPFKDQQSRAQVAEKLQQIANYGQPQEWHRLGMQFGDEGKVHVAIPVYIVKTDKMDAEVTLKFGDIDGVWRLLGFEGSAHTPNR